MACTGTLQLLTCCSTGLDLHSATSLHASADDLGYTYWWPTLAIACSPLDSVQTNVMIDRHDVHRHIMQCE